MMSLFTIWLFSLDDEKVGSRLRGRAKRSAPTVEGQPFSQRFVRAVHSLAAKDSVSRGRGPFPTQTQFAAAHLGKNDDVLNR